MRDLTGGGLAHLALNWATVREKWSLAETIEGCARHGIPGIAPWREPVQAMGAEAAGRRIRDAGLRVSGYCRAGLFPAADRAGLDAAIEDNRRAIDEAAALGAECLVILGGGMPAGSRDLPLARGQARDGIAAILPYARERSVPLALEPLHPMYAADRCCISTLKQANDLCEELIQKVRAVSAWRSTSTTSSGTRSSIRRLGARARPAASRPSTSATGWCRPGTSCSTVA